MESIFEKFKSSENFVFSPSKIKLEIWIIIRKWKKEFISIQKSADKDNGWIS